MTTGSWLRLTAHPSGSSIAINMINVWRLDEGHDGTTEIHSLGANTAGASASVRVSQSVDAILAMLDRDAVPAERDDRPPANQNHFVRHLYRSSNGDEWSLERDDRSRQVFVRHRANEASGGTESCVEVGRFLCSGGDDPQRRELIRLIGTLV